MESGGKEIVFLLKRSSTQCLVPGTEAVWEWSKDKGFQWQAVWKAAPL